MSKRTAEFVLTAKNEASNTLAKVSGDVKGLGSTFTGLGKIAGPVLAIFGAGLSAKGIADMVQHANDLTDSLNDSSTRLGVNISDLQAFQGAALKAGMSTEQLDGLIKKLNKNAGDIKLNQSSKEIVGAFDRIGISVQAVKKSDPGQLFEDVINRLGSIKDPAARAATAMQIFGKSGADALTLVADGADGLEEEKQMLAELGLTLNKIDASKVGEANDTLDNLKFVAQAAKQKLGAELAPVITLVGNLLLDAAKKGGGLGPMIFSGVDTAIRVIDRLISAGSLIGNTFMTAFRLVELGTVTAKAGVISLGASLLDALGVRGVDAVNGLLDKTGKGLTQMKQGFVDFATAAANAVIGAMNKSNKAIEDLVNLAIEGINKMIDTSNSVAGTSFSRLDKVQSTPITPYGRFPVDPIELGTVSYFGEETRDKWDKEAAEALAYSNELTGKIGESTRDAMGSMLDLTSGDGGPLAQGWEKQIGAVKTLKKEIGGDYSGGGGIPEAVDKANKKIKESFPKAIEVFDIVGEYGKAVTSTLEKSIDDFVKTGELNIKQFSASILQEIAAITLKAAILGDILGQSKYGGDGSGLVGSLFAGILSGGGKGTATPGGHSFEGGGFTGSGSRSGGIDGRGGFSAILHPNETVVDHERGQSMGSSVTVHQTVVIRETMPAGQAMAIQKAATDAAMAKVQTINDRGGKRRQRLLGKS